MTLTEANQLLDAAVTSDKPSKVNPSMTVAQAIDIVRKGINAGPRALAEDGMNLNAPMEYRVLQVTRNQSRPRRL